MKKKIAIIIVTILLISLLIILNLSSKGISKINLTNLTYHDLIFDKKIKIYTEKDYNKFLKDYKSNNLPKVYITKFLFDGVGMYKIYDIEEFETQEEPNTKTLEITTLNINSVKKIELSGKFEGMIAVNTNNLKSDMNILLNGVDIKTENKKAPAIYVYNKDVAYDKHKVTITTKENTKNYIEGGRLKAVSLMPKEEIENYKELYKKNIKNNFEKYRNFYGVYSKEELNNILFATVKTDDEGIKEGDPLYFYKAAGAISSDIDIYFNGNGYLEVTSLNKEGIESKGNIDLKGKQTEYVIKAMNDCLNTSSTNEENENAKNSITIDVKSLTTIVSTEAREGDAIDSNGTLTINGGNIIAISKSGHDAGLDSSKGTFINGGTILAIGDMYDEVNINSNQKTVSLSFSEPVLENTLITMLKENEEVEFAFKTDRPYTYLVYSSPDLNEENYELYLNGKILGNQNNGFYKTVKSYEKGTKLNYTIENDSLSINEKFNLNDKINIFKNIKIY